MPLFPTGAMSLVRKLSQSHLLSAARLGVVPSGRTLLSALQESGLGYRTQDFYSDWNYWKEAVERGKKLKYTWKGEVLGQDLYMKTSYEMKARYETLVNVKWKSALTGEIHESIYTISHEHLENGIKVPDTYQRLTRADIEEAAKKMSRAGDPERYGEVLSVMPIMGFYNPNI